MLTAFITVANGNNGHNWKKVLFVLATVTPIFWYASQPNLMHYIHCTLRYNVSEGIFDKMFLKKVIVIQNMT